MGVCVILNEQGKVLHGEDTLQRMLDYGSTLACMDISGVNRAQFEASDYPAILEAGKQAF